MTETLRFALSLSQIPWRAFEYNWRKRPSISKTMRSQVSFADPVFVIAICSPYRSLRVGLPSRRREKSWQNLYGSAEKFVLSGPSQRENCTNTGMFRVFLGKVLPCSTRYRLRGGEQDIRTLGTGLKTVRPDVRVSSRHQQVRKLSEDCALPALL